MADIAKQKEVTRRYELELEDAMMRVAALEVSLSCSIFLDGSASCWTTDEWVSIVIM
jgi:hypothetical protein